MAIMKPLLLAMILLAANAFAGETGSIQYTGQESDQLELQTVKVETRYRSEERDSTCTRKVPYTERVCGYETRYREECTWRPGRNVCRTVNRRVCRTVRRTRRECSTGPGRQVCRNTPPRRQCRNINGRQVCRDIPGRRVCRTEPGRRVCRDVPYNERVCRNVPEQECRYEPGRNVCRQVPYQEYVCRDVTRYREETYACRRTVQIPYSFNKKIFGEVNVSFNDQNDPLSVAGLDFILNGEGDMDIKVTDRSPNPALIFVNKTMTNDGGVDELRSTGQFNVQFISKEKALAPISTPFSAVSLNSKRLAFNMGAIHPNTSMDLAIKIVRKRSILGDKTLINRTLSSSEFSISPNGRLSAVNINLANLGVKIKDKDHKVGIEVRLKLKGNSVNPPTRNLVQKQSYDL